MLSTNAEIGVGRQHMRMGLRAPPVGELRRRGSQPRKPRRGARCAGALGSSEKGLGRWVTKLTGKISGRPARQMTNRPNDKLDRRLQHSSSPSTVTGGPTMEMKQHVDVSPRPKKPGHDRVGGEPPRSFDPCLHPVVLGMELLGDRGWGWAARDAA